MNKAAADIYKILKRYWGYDTFRPLQREIIDSVLSGTDTLGLLPTGGGKSITFQVPAMALDGVSLVITPLISLMKDQVDNLRNIGIRAVCIHSGLTRAETQLGIDKCRLGKTKLLYASPEKLLSENFIFQLRTLPVSMIVVDEAHCISQWGYDFRPAYLKINKLRKFFPNSPVLALTASATPEVVTDIKLRLDFGASNAVFRKSFSRPNISYIVRNDLHKANQLLNILTHTRGSAIVYVRSRKRTGEIAQMLNNEGISALNYHAGMAPEDKDQRQEKWKQGLVRVMVATNAFGMGIDKPDVRVVVHMDIPGSLEEYYQEAGRAGRDGLTAYAVLIVSRYDKTRLTRSVNEAFPPKPYIQRVYELVGNFLDIAIGEGFDHVYEFNREKFISTYGLDDRLVKSALTLLSQANYFDYTDDITTQSRIMFICNKNELYNIDLTSADEVVLNAILRCYTGLFADFVYINEDYIAKTASVTPEQVYTTLLKLSRMHILQFVPKKTTPYIYYTTSRELPKHVVLPRAVYEDQRERMQKRVDAIKQYAFDTDKCRVQTMLTYFGETDASPCSTCDVCRDLRNVTNRPSPDKLSKDILNTLKVHPCHIKELTEIIRNSETINTVRRLVSRGKLKIDSDGIISLKN
ncbi:MAG: RecQ family ATP-dependent DNA helicase [Muribaculum sp.]|nr:RecQ family ATP-dependent DNA helicase [Muribaculaceae bacterium]MCM1080633.1 RecQ family ATP-dependent DNA helicase [Muribaculum sp.]